MYRLAHRHFESLSEKLYIRDRIRKGGSVWYSSVHPRTAPNTPFMPRLRRKAAETQSFTAFASPPSSRVFCNTCQQYYPLSNFTLNHVGAPYQPCKTCKKSVSRNTRPKTTVCSKLTSNILHVLREPAVNVVCLLLKVNNLVRKEDEQNPVLMSYLYFPRVIMIRKFSMMMCSIICLQIHLQS